MQASASSPSFSAGGGGSGDASDTPSQDQPQQLGQQISGFIQAFWKFVRPHTIRGTVGSLCTSALRFVHTEMYLHFRKAYTHTHTHTHTLTHTHFHKLHKCVMQEQSAYCVGVPPILLSSEGCRLI
jgi:hypothetical protein